MEKTIAEEFQHNFDNDNFRIFDSNHNKIYYETLSGYWQKRQYNNNKMVRCEDSYGYWSMHTYDDNNNEIYFEDSTGYVKITLAAYSIELTPLGVKK